MSENNDNNGRTFFGKIIKWSFIGFNILMFLWMVIGLGGATSKISQSTNEIEQAGATIGTGIGAMVIIFLWVCGALILGVLTLLTRSKK